jgi:hypothetical protein
MKSSFHYRTHAAEAGLIWSILQTKGASTYSRPIGANGPSVALKAFELAWSEQQSPTHPALPACRRTNAMGWIDQPNLIRTQSRRAAQIADKITALGAPTTPSDSRCDRHLLRR